MPVSFKYGSVFPPVNGINPTTAAYDRLAQYAKHVAFENDYAPGSKEWAALYDTSLDAPLPTARPDSLEELASMVSKAMWPSGHNAFLDNPAFYHEFMRVARCINKVYGLGLKPEKE